MDYKNLRRILENPQNRDTLMKEISKEVPVGAFVRPGFYEDNKIDPTTFKPTNTPALTEPVYDAYKGNIKHLVGTHVNDVNRNLLTAATEETPDLETANRVIKSVYGVDMDKDVNIYQDPILDKDNAYGMTHQNYSPMRAASTIRLNPTDELPDATLIHELKHAHDNQNTHIKIPKIDLQPKKDKGPKYEQTKDADIDAAITALSKNDLKSLNQLYSGDHFDHDTTIAEDAQKLYQFSKLKPFITGK